MRMRKKSQIPVFQTRFKKWPHSTVGVRPA
jgi:hypothetical protein